MTPDSHRWKRVFFGVLEIGFILMIPIAIGATILQLERQIPGRINVINGNNLNIVASPDIVDFGDLTVGGNVTRYFTIRNIGDAQLWLTATIILDYNSTAMSGTMFPVNGTRLQFPVLSIPNEGIMFAVTISVGTSEVPGTYYPLIIVNGVQR